VQNWRVSKGLEVNVVSFTKHSQSNEESGGNWQLAGCFPFLLQRATLPE